MTGASTGGGEASAGPLAHGGRLADLARLFPGARRPFIDLSTGVNPVPYPIPELPPEVFARLPEPDDVARLEAAAACAYGVADPASVVAAPGTQILIGLLPLLFPQPAVTVLGPTYAEHAAAWRRSGAAVTEAASPGDGALALCNPDNPGGGRIGPSTILEWARTRPLTVVDEAFADLEGPGLSVAGALPHPSLVVLRSFGKTYGLAGVRLGFALASPERAAVIRRALGPWAVSGPAVAIGRTALGDAAWLAATRTRLERDGLILDAMLARAGLPVRGGARLFRLAEGAGAAGAFQALGEAGILVRRFADAPTRLRFGLPGEEQTWSRLAEALGRLA